MARVNLSQAYIQKVADSPELQHGAVRLGAWLVALAERRHATSFEVFYTNVINGYDRDGVQMKGIAFRPPTVAKSFEALEDAGIITLTEGATMRGGHYPKICTIHL